MTGYAALKARRKATGREAWLDKVEASKHAAMVFRYRIGHKREGWWDVPWCKPWSDECRLIMTWNIKLYADWWAYQKLKFHRTVIARYNHWKMVRELRREFKGEN